MKGTPEEYADVDWRGYPVGDVDYGKDARKRGMGGTWYEDGKAVAYVPVPGHVRMDVNDYTDPLHSLRGPAGNHGLVEAVRAPSYPLDSRIVQHDIQLRRFLGRKEYVAFRKRGYVLIQSKRKPQVQYKVYTAGGIDVEVNGTCRWRPCLYITSAHGTTIPETVLNFAARFKSDEVGTLRMWGVNFDNLIVGWV